MRHYIKAFLAPLAALLLMNGAIVTYKEDRYFENLPKAFAAGSGQIGGTRDLVLAGLGLRALAASLAFLDMLAYYGSNPAGHEHADAWEAVSGFGSDTGFYLDIFVLGRRIIGLDPFFRYAVLYAANALAFNEGRNDQAVALIREAMIKDPRYWPYSLNLSAIAYKKTGDFAKLVELLESIAGYPECPDMLKNILGNIYIKMQRYPQAVKIFVDMAQKSTDKEYRRLAQEKLEFIEGLRRHRPH